jgi:ABC-type histidine transport system ATPase subunit
MPPRTENFGGSPVASVEIRNIRKNFGTVPVIHGVSIDIQDGEFVILVGPSGSADFSPSASCLTTGMDPPFAAQSRLSSALGSW